MIPIFLDLTGTIEKDFTHWINSLIGGLIKLFLEGLGGLGSIILGAIKSAVGGLLGFVGVPFSAWSQYVANNGTWWIPIIFVAILGIAFLVAEGINIVYGFEKDIGQGEADIGTEEEHIAEEEEEG